MRNSVAFGSSIALLAALTLGCSSGKESVSRASGSSTGKSKSAALPQLAPNLRRVCGEAAQPGYARCFAVERTDMRSTRALGPKDTPAGLVPSDLISAYSLPSQGTTDQTVAIVDAQDYPNAEADLAVYRAQFGLPACTTANGCFKKVNQDGLASAYPTEDDNWSEEMALDLDMVSASCPTCKIVLVEANSASMPDLGAAVNTAASLGASAVSNSYGGSEDGTELQADTAYFTHSGVTITASTGDSGYGVSYPASSENVIAVGGTSLTKDSSARGWGETAWSGSGSGCSNDIPALSFQQVAGCSFRAIADVSAVADPQTGVAIYFTQGGSAGWTTVGGTSVSSPLMAGILAFTGVAGADNSFPYKHTNAFTNITSGSNGTCTDPVLCNAGPGWNGPTGLGTPIGSMLVTSH